MKFKEWILKEFTSIYPSGKNYMKKFAMAHDPGSILWGLKNNKLYWAFAWKPNFFINDKFYKSNPILNHTDLWEAADIKFNVDNDVYGRITKNNEIIFYNEQLAYMFPRALKAIYKYIGSVKEARKKYKKESKKRKT